MVNLIQEDKVEYSQEAERQKVEYDKKMKAYRWVIIYESEILKHTYSEEGAKRAKVQSSEEDDEDQNDY